MQTADHILIPLLDGRHALAQVADAGAAVTTLLITAKLATPTSPTSALRPDDVIAVLHIDRASGSDTNWPVIGYEAIPTGTPTAPQTADPDSTLDPAVVEAFVNAIHGLYPWDGFPDHNFFSALLKSPDTLPPKARMTADFPSPE